MELGNAVLALAESYSGSNDALASSVFRFVATWAVYDRARAWASRGLDVCVKLWQRVNRGATVGLFARAVCHLIHRSGFPFRPVLTQSGALSELLLCMRKHSEEVAGEVTSSVELSLFWMLRFLDNIFFGEITSSCPLKRDIVLEDGFIEALCRSATPPRTVPVLPAVERVVTATKLLFTLCNNNDELVQQRCLETGVRTVAVVISWWLVQHSSSGPDRLWKPATALLRFLNADVSSDSRLWRSCLVAGVTPPPGIESHDNDQDSPFAQLMDWVELSSFVADECARSPRSQAGVIASVFVPHLRSLVENAVDSVPALLLTQKELFSLWFDHVLPCGQPIDVDAESGQRDQQYGVPYVKANRSEAGSLH